MRMDVLPHGFDFLPGIGNGLTDPRRRGAAGYVVDRKHRLQS